MACAGSIPFDLGFCDVDIGHCSEVGQARPFYGNGFVVLHVCPSDQVNYEEIVYTRILSPSELLGVSTSTWHCRTIPKIVVGSSRNHPPVPGTHQFFDAYGICSGAVHHVDPPDVPVLL